MTTHLPNIRTGHSEQPAIFCPVLHTLTLLKGEDAERIELGYSGSRLLARLMLEPGQMVTRETLISHAWSERIVGQGSLNQQVYMLRKILGDEKNRQIIQTVPRRGYLLNPAFLVESTSPAARNDETLDTPLDIAMHLLSKQPDKHPVARSVARRKWTLSMVLAMPLVGYLFSMSPPQLYAHWHQGAANIPMSTDNRQPQAQKLIGHTHSLTERLIKLSDKPVVLAIIGGEAGYYHVHCSVQPGQNRTITLHDSETQGISDSQLRECVY